MIPGIININVILRLFGWMATNGYAAYSLPNSGDDVFRTPEELEHAYAQRTSWIDLAW